MVNQIQQSLVRLTSYAYTLKTVTRTLTPLLGRGMGMRVGGEEGSKPGTVG